jgi:hypothetical protein
VKPRSGASTLADALGAHSHTQLCLPGSQEVPAAPAPTLHLEKIRKEPVSWEEGGLTVPAEEDIPTGLRGDLGGGS